MSERMRFAASVFAQVAAPLVIVAGLISTAFADEENYTANGYGVSGYDPVAYHTEGQPVEGVSTFTANHNGVTYRFSSSENRDTFSSSPESFVPQYGGFCAFGTAMGRKFNGDPMAWKIVDGKLYLNLNANVQQQWIKDIPGFVRGADHNWPIIRTVADKDLESSPPIGITLGAQ